MKRLSGFCCVAAFLVICAGVGWFLLQFTESAPAFDYPVWEEGAVACADGTETPFDVTGLPPQLAEDEHLLLQTTLPQGRENGEWLIFETAGLDCTVFLDGEEIWSSSATQDADTVNLSQVQLPLASGGGERLSMALRQTGEAALIPPVLRLSADPTDQAGAIAYANRYGIPAGISAVALALLCGMFLLSLHERRMNARLLLPALAAGALALNGLATGYGDYFLPAWLTTLLSARWMMWVAPVALLLYLVLHRERAFWKGMGLATATSLAALALLYGLSRLRGGYLARYLEEQLPALAAGYYDGLLYWFTLWLVLVTTLLAAWSLVRSMAQAEAAAQTLALKNQLMLENVQSLERRIRASAGAQHETSHRLAALDVMLRAGNLDGLAESLAAWRADNSRAARPRFCDNLTINAILQDADARAEAAAVCFSATVSVPQTLPLPDEDLCILLMNMLDNALEGAISTPADETRRIHLQLRSTGGFLAILCENSYDGQVQSDLASRKSDALAHGFGLGQMRRICEKYHSILDVQPNGRVFTVQTALKLPQA